MWYYRSFILVVLGLVTLLRGAELEDIDGGYTEWSEWAECSAHCEYTEYTEVGKERRSRTCTNPKPEGNGKTCEEQGLGPAERSRECYVNSCFNFGMFLLGDTGLYVFLGLTAFGILACIFYCTYCKKQKPRQTTATSGQPTVTSLREGEHSPHYAEECEQQLNSVRRASLQGMRVPNRREREVPTGNPLGVLIVELPPLRSGEEPPPPYSGEQPHPLYSGEQPPPPYREEQPEQPYSGESQTNSREELPPPYPEVEPLPVYAVTSFV